MHAPLSEEECWALTPSSGFLMVSEQPVSLAPLDPLLGEDHTEPLEVLSAGMPALLQGGHAAFLHALADLPPADLDAMVMIDDHPLLERLFQIFATLAQVSVWGGQPAGGEPNLVIPAVIARPLVHLAARLDRPPILSYAMTCLANWRRLDQDGGWDVDNTAIVQALIGTPDEAWFHRIHIEIEAEAGAAVVSADRARAALADEDIQEAIGHLQALAAAVNEFTTTFRRIPEHCRPEVYFATLRPYLFGFDGVIYDGVEAFGGRPQVIAGQTGAQSPAIPALQRHLGLVHSPGELADTMLRMLDHMPVPHRRHLRGIDTLAIRAAVRRSGDRELIDAYNECLIAVSTFRTVHVRMAWRYVADKVVDGTGTGGTNFMPWLTAVRDETMDQLL